MRRGCRAAAPAGGRCVRPVCWRRQSPAEHQRQSVHALQYAKKVGAAIVGVVGRDGGYTAQVADACVIIPTVNPETITPHSEAFQAVVWHLLVSHPLSKQRPRNGSRPSDSASGRFSRSRRRHQPGDCTGRLPYAPSRVEDVEVLPGVHEALVRLKAAGFALVVVTNQPDVARGSLSADALQAMHDHLAALLPVDEWRVCCDDDRDGRDCRKPKAGLLTRAPFYDLSRSVVVWRRWRDIEAGRRAGCRASMDRYGYDEGHASSRTFGFIVFRSSRLDSLDHGDGMSGHTAHEDLRRWAELDGMIAFYRYRTSAASRRILPDAKGWKIDYRRFVHQVLAAIRDGQSHSKFFDVFEEMERQASEIATWATRLRESSGDEY